MRRAGSPELRRFPVLDALRGVAALTIVTRHFPWRDGVPIVLPHDYLAVDLFFVLSGFVLAHAYGQALEQRGQWRLFMSERLIRLYPLYFAATFATLALYGTMALAGGEVVPAFPGIPALILALFFLPGIGGAASIPYPFCGPAWSLFWELVANLAFAVMAPWLNNRVLGRVVGIGAILLILSASIYGSLDTGAYWVNFAGGGARVAYSFFAGVAIYRARQHFGTVAVVPGWLLLLVLLACFLPTEDGLGIGYDIVITLILFPAMVFLAADATTSRRTSAIGIWLGSISYALYVIHGSVLGLMKSVSPGLTGRHLVDWHFAGLLAFLVASMLAAAVLEPWFDRPARAWLKRLWQAFSGRRPASQAAQPTTMPPVVR